MNNKVVKILHIITLFLTAIFIVGFFYVKNNFATTNFESLVFYSTSSMESADMSTLKEALKLYIPIILALFIILYTIFYDITFGKFQLKHYPFKFRYKTFIIMSLLIISITGVFQSLKVFDYIYNEFSKSNFIEENYIDPKDKVKFDNKRNLIFIVVESLESSLFTKNQGGVWDYEVMPELYNLQKDNISFNTIGYNMLQSSSYTTSSVITSNSAIPVKVGMDRKGYSEKSFIKGAYTLGDMLYDNGYNNEVISGANTVFGSLNYFYHNHGKFNIIDLDTLSDYGYKMTKDDYGKWGINDKYLFDLAKKRLDVLSKEDKPFDLQLITIDTHFTDGFIGKYSETKFDRQYENAYATTSKIINEFVNYVKEKPYFENTTIVIMGDHEIMQSNFMNDKMAKERLVYSTFINPNKQIINNKKRMYTALDIYPTIISSIGGIIDEDKIGLGVNLFSDRETLAEKYGIKKLNNNLKKKSIYYNKLILGIE